MEVLSSYCKCRVWKSAQNEVHHIYSSMYMYTLLIVYTCVTVNCILTVLCDNLYSIAVGMFPFADEGSPVTSLSFDWTSYNFTSLQISWQPETTPQGGLVRYTVHYSPIMNNILACQTTSAHTTDTTIIISCLNPELFYSVSVAVDVQDAPPSGRPV